jgi:hypothetical protein
MLEIENSLACPMVRSALDLFAEARGSTAIQKFIIFGNRREMHISSESQWNFGSRAFLCGLFAEPQLLSV